MPLRPEWVQLKLPVRIIVADDFQCEYRYMVRGQSHAWARIQPES